MRGSSDRIRGQGSATSVSAGRLLPRPLCHIQSSPLSDVGGQMSAGRGTANRPTESYRTKNLCTIDPLTTGPSDHESQSFIARTETSAGAARSLGVEPGRRSDPLPPPPSRWLMTSIKIHGLAKWSCGAEFATTASGRNCRQLSTLVWRQYIPEIGRFSELSSGARRAIRSDPILCCFDGGL